MFLCLCVAMSSIAGALADFFKQAGEPAVKQAKVDTSPLKEKMGAENAALFDALTFRLEVKIDAKIDTVTQALQKVAEQTDEGFAKIRRDMDALRGFIAGSVVTPRLRESSPQSARGNRGSSPQSPNGRTPRLDTLLGTGYTPQLDALLGCESKNPWWR